MAEKLKIYACSGIGAAQADKPVAYWTDNTNTVSNTQAVNSLLAAINSDYIKFSRLRSLSKADKLTLLNEIDLLTVCLDAATRYSGKAAALHHAGLVIGGMVKKGLFDFDSLNETQRDNNLDELLDMAHEAYNEEEAPAANAEFMTWWSETVEMRDKVGLTKQQQDAFEEAAAQITGIGSSDNAWMKNADLAEYLTKGGTYFLYCYFTEAQLKKLPAVFRRKAAVQMRTYNYCKALFVNVYGNEDAMQEIIHASIIDQYGETAEQVCATIMNTGKISGIGDGGVTAAVLTAADIVAIVTAVLGLVGTIIVAVIEYCKNVGVAKYAAIDKEAAEAATPNPDDFNGLNIGSTKATSWLPLAAIGVGLLFLLKS